MGLSTSEPGLAAALKSDYYSVPLKIYQPGDIIEEDLYFLYQGQYLIYRLKNLLWSEHDPELLKSFGVETLYIRCRTKREHEKFLEAHIRNILETSSISSKVKAELLYQNSLSILEDVFANPISAINLRRSMTSVKNSIDYIGRDKTHFFEFMRLAKTDFSEYTHALHVAAYAITLAKELGIRAFNEISALGIGAILHDLGKVKVDSKILNKQEPLTEHEWVELEKHPTYGYELVHSVGTLPSLSEAILLSHHERPNGQGYPRGISDDLHIFTQVISICDSFDLMTSDRAYQKACKPIDAIHQLRTQNADEYDQRLIISFVKMLKIKD